METEFRSKVNDIGALLKYFHVERMVYLISTIVSFIILIVCAIWMVFQDGESYTSLFGLFGSTGVISYTASRLLRMWTDAVNMLTKIDEDE